jgi:hypothetical protein
MEPLVALPPELAATQPIPLPRVAAMAYVSDPERQELVSPRFIEKKTDAG